MPRKRTGFRFSIVTGTHSSKYLRIVASRQLGCVMISHCTLYLGGSSSAAVHGGSDGDVACVARINKGENKNAYAEKVHELSEEWAAETI